MASRSAVVSKLLTMVGLVLAPSAAPDLALLYIGPFKHILWGDNDEALF